MKTILFIVILVTSLIYFNETYYKYYDLVCVDRRIVKWVGVCDRYARCVVGFEDGSVRKSVNEPYIGEKRCLKTEFKNIKGLK